MKKTEIVLIVLVAVIIGVIMSLTFNASTYITFADSEKQMGKEFTVIGSLNKEKDIIGMYISGHPLDNHKTDIDFFSNASENSNVAELQTIVIANDINLFVLL